MDLLFGRRPVLGPRVAESEVGTKVVRQSPCRLRNWQAGGRGKYAYHRTAKADE